MEVLFGSRAKLRELKVLAAFRDRAPITLSDLAYIFSNNTDKIEPVAALTAAVIDLRHYGLVEEDKEDPYSCRPKKFKLTEKGKQ